MSEDLTTERAAEIDRVNRWNARLEAVWEQLQDSPHTLKVEYIHKFVASFNTLSRARRELRALDMPRRLIVEDATDNQAPASIDAEVQRLTKSLSMNDANADKS